MKADHRPHYAVKVAHSMDVWKDGQLGMKIRVTEVTPLATPPDAKTFELPGHDWQRAFTDEAR